MEYQHKINVMISKDEIVEAVKKLGERITEDYRNKPVVLVGVLKGSFIFMSDLVRAIDLPLNLDFIHANSNIGTQTVGAVNINMDT